MHFTPFFISFQSFFPPNMLFGHISTLEIYTPAYILTKKVIYFFQNSMILIIFLIFLCTTRIHAGSVSWLYDADPDLAK